jgi:hypothetical protein
MITQLIENVASFIKSSNVQWLTQVRTLGHLSRSQNGSVVLTDELEEIGVTDIEGNSAYIRFRNDQGWSSQNITSVTGDPAYRYVFSLKLVVLVRGSNPTDLGLLLTRQLNSYSLLSSDQANNVRCIATGGSSNTLTVMKGENGADDANVSYRLFMIDFNLQFDDHQICNFDESVNNIPMLCNCTQTLELPCVGSCSEISTGFEASEQILTVVSGFNGNRIEFDIEHGGGEVILDASLFNADYTFIIQILDAEGVILTQEVEEVTYNCVSVKIEP